MRHRLRICLNKWFTYSINTTGCTLVCFIRVRTTNLFLNWKSWFLRLIISLVNHLCLYWIRVNTFLSILFDNWWLLSYHCIFFCYKSRGLCYRWILIVIFKDFKINFVIWMFNGLFFLKSYILWSMHHIRLIFVFPLHKSTQRDNLDSHIFGLISFIHGRTLISRRWC